MPNILIPFDVPVWMEFLIRASLLLIALLIAYWLTNQILGKPD